MGENSMIATTMRRAFAALSAGGLLAAAAASAEPVTVPLDGETQVGGVAAACTGVGQTKLDPKWRGYSVRVEFADAQSAYLADVEAVVSQADGTPVADVRCEGPWVLFKLPPGRYHVQGSLTGSAAKPQNAAVAAPASGQARVVLHFPDA
jgi:hypothetical protein